MVELAALVMLAAAAASLHAGWSLNAEAASHPYAAHALTVYWGLPALGVLLVITAFGLFARKRWAHFPALAACFAAPAVLALALAALAAGGWMLLLLVLFGWGDQPGTLRTNPGAVYTAGLVALIGIPLALYFSWRLFKHLRSEAVRREFGVTAKPGAPAEFHPGGVLIAVLALLSGLSSLSPWRADGKSLPSWLRTDAMKVQVTAADERADALLASDAMISDDERTIVFASHFHPRFVHFWDLASGRLERKETGHLAASPPWRSFSPDGKSVVADDGALVSLATASKRKLQSMRGLGPAKHLGFAGPDRFLLYTGGWPYDTRSLKLMLLDLAADRILYEKVLPGDYAEGGEGYAEPLAGAYSPDRSLYAWHDSRTHRLNLLRVPTGELEQFECHCRASHLVTFSREGDLLYIAGEGVRSGKQPYPKGVVFSLADKAFTPGLAFGPILFASTREDRLLQWSVDEPPSIIEYPARRFDAPRWQMPLDGAQPAVTPDGTKLILVGRQAPWEVRVAELSKQGSAPPGFQPVRSSIGRKASVKVSASGRLVLMLGSPMAEVLSPGNAVGAAPLASAIDLRVAGGPRN